MKIYELKFKFWLWVEDVKRWFYKIRNEVADMDTEHKDTKK